MTGARFKELKENPSLISSREEEASFERMLAWEIRSNRAKRAAETKRRKYTKWPTRNRDHKVKP